MAAKRFREHFCIIEVLKPDTPTGQTERNICMNATGRRFQIIIGMASLVGLMDSNKLVKARASPTARTKKDKVPISELILFQNATDENISSSR